MASLPLSVATSPTRYAAMIAGGASVGAAMLVLFVAHSVILAAAFLAAGIVVGGAVIAWRTLAPVAKAGPREIDWDFTRAVAEASADAVAVTDRAGRLVCANDAYEKMFDGFPTPPGLPLVGDGVAVLGKAGRAAWRDGRASASGFATDRQSLSTEIVRAGDESDMLVWRFVPIIDRDLGEIAADLIAGEAGDRLGASGVMAALVDANGRIRAGNRVLATRAIRWTARISHGC